MAAALLLAALGQIAWALAHAAIHEHLAQHHRAATPHLLVSAPDLHESGTRPLASPQRPYDHEHPAAVFLRPTRCTDAASPATLPSATPSHFAVAARQWSIYRESVLSRASPEASGPSDPRAPPIA
jgi:hypothetical protein